MNAKQRRATARKARAAAKRKANRSKGRIENAFCERQRKAPAALKRKLEADRLSADELRCLLRSAFQLKAYRKATFSLSALVDLEKRIETIDGVRILSVKLSRSQGNVRDLPSFGFRHCGGRWHLILNS